MFHFHLVDLSWLPHPVIPEQMKEAMPANQLFANTWVIQLGISKVHMQELYYVGWYAVYHILFSQKL